jgi:two-component system, cell cycle sensor histidine kinase and response regulator CckA
MNKYKRKPLQVLFPATEGEVVATPEKVHAEADWCGSGTVLLVDDSPMVRTIGTRMLKRLGMTVLVACDGRQGIDIFAQHADEIDCVLLDLTMPQLDGEQTFRELRRIAPDVRVIISSGYSEQEVNQRFRGESIAGFLHKPYEIKKLAQILRGALET